MFHVSFFECQLSHALLICTFFIVGRVWGRHCHHALNKGTRSNVATKLLSTGEAQLHFRHFKSRLQENCRQTVSLVELSLLTY